MQNNMWTKGLVIGTIVLMVGASVVSALNANPYKNSTSTKSGNWLYVGGSGPGNYTRIQDAIDDASDGDTVFVYNGTYFEPLHIYKRINLSGESRYNTIIHAGNITNVISITNKSISTIQGFTICKGTNGIGAFYPGGWEDHIIIKDNIIRDCKTGISLGSNLIIKDNIIRGCENGIYLDGGNDYNITYNIITNNENGIYLYIVRYNININHNWILNNSNAGIVIDRSLWPYSTVCDCNICFNELKNNGRYGLIFILTKENTIEYNNFIDNGDDHKSHATFVQSFDVTNFIDYLEGLPLKSKNNWKHNYWSDNLISTNITRYIIFGVMIIFNILKIKCCKEFDFQPNPNPNPIL